LRLAAALDEATTTKTRCARPVDDDDDVMGA
jgi:hypothetical protein